MLRHPLPPQKLTTRCVPSVLQRGKATITLQTCLKTSIPHSERQLWLVFRAHPHLPSLFSLSCCFPECFSGFRQILRRQQKHIRSISESPQAQLPPSFGGQKDLPLAAPCAGVYQFGKWSPDNFLRPLP